MTALRGQEEVAAQRERSATKLNERIIEFFDETLYSDPTHQEYFSHGGFSNLGLWTKPDLDGAGASKELIGALLERLTSRSGRVLDVACGQGASTRVLAGTFGPSNVVGINIGPKQIEAARNIAPGCTFHLMDAVNLDFPDESFDHVMCIEAACHFDSREEFLREAFRVLKPGGTLAMSDVIFSWYLPPTIPRINHLRSGSEYGALLQRAGFNHIRVDDEFERVVTPASEKVRRFAWLKLREHGLPRLKSFMAIWLGATAWRYAFREYLLISATKPTAVEGAK
jgi:MPBQ/MSBQ methyltransferase